MNTEAVRTYISACNREHAECAQELVDALNSNAKVAQLGQRAVPLNDIDICCVAEAIRALEPECALKVLNLEENSFGLQGVQALMEAVESNPGHIKELRLGKNNLKDQAAITIGHTLSRDGCGLKVLDLSENGISKLGVIPIAAAVQHATSDIVELSFHNNKIEGDAAPFLCQAIRESPKLKHLHLGYNTLRDSGVAQLAKSLPQARYLSTLDLTANRVGHEGGLAIASALMDPGCTIQRLNLRHNLLDSDAIAAFADVLRENKSLIQLFLGFMNPTPDVAEEILEAVRDNPTVLLLDIYGWKLDPKSAEPLIRAVQEGTGAIAAIVTDACQPITASIDEGNILRENRDQHPIYVGPDDRDAYLATKSLRRYSRAQSRRQSRVSSARASRSRADQEPSQVSRASSRRRRGTAETAPGGDEVSHGSRHGSRRHSRRHSRRSSRAASVATGDKDGAGTQKLVEQSSPGGASGEPERKARREEKGSEVNATADRAPSAHRRSSSRRHRTPRNGAPASAPADEDAANGVVVSPRSAPQSARDTASEGPERQHEVDRLLDELQDTPCDPKTAETVTAIVRALQSQIRHQRAQHKREMRAVNARLDALETRRECQCGDLNGSASRAASAGHPRFGPSTGAQPPSYLGANPNNSYDVGGSVAGETHPAPFARADSTGVAASALGSARIGFSSARRQQGPPSYARSASRMSDAGGRMERSMTPLVHPNSEIRDILPDLPRPNDESGERKPEEASLQRSASVQNFPPRIEPSPAQDADPPRRKSIAHNF